MKSNRFIYSGIIFLAIFVAAILFQSFIGHTSHFAKKSPVAFTVKKRVKLIEAPNNLLVATEQNFFEKETEDKAKSEMKSSVSVLSLFQNLDPTSLSLKSYSHVYSDKKANCKSNLLYLIVRSIRV